MLVRMLPIVAIVGVALSNCAVAGGDGEENNDQHTADSSETSASHPEQDNPATPIGIETIYGQEYVEVCSDQLHCKRSEPARSHVVTEPRSEERRVGKECR